MTLIQRRGNILRDTTRDSSSSIDFCMEIYTGIREETEETCRVDLSHFHPAFILLYVACERVSIGISVRPWRGRNGNYAVTRIRDASSLSFPPFGIAAKRAWYRSFGWRCEWIHSTETWRPSPSLDSFRNASFSFFFLFFNPFWVRFETGVRARRIIGETSFFVSSKIYIFNFNFENVLVWECSREICTLMQNWLDNRKKSGYLQVCNNVLHKTQLKWEKFVNFS